MTCTHMTIMFAIHALSLSMPIPLSMLCLPAHASLLSPYHIHQSECQSEESDRLDITKGDSKDTLTLCPEQIDIGFSMEGKDQAPPSFE